MKRQPNSAEKSAPSAALPPLPQTSNFLPAQRQSTIESAARAIGCASSCNDWNVLQAARIESRNWLVMSLIFLICRLSCRYNCVPGVAKNFPKMLHQQSPLSLGKRGCIAVPGDTRIIHGRSQLRLGCRLDPNAYFRRLRGQIEARVEIKSYTEFLKLYKL